MLKTATPMTLAREAGAAGHVWDAERRVLEHGAHNSLAVPFPCRFFRQSTLAPRGQGGRVRGD